jgi:hypothetical protein
VSNPLEATVLVQILIVGDVQDRMMLSIKCAKRRHIYTLYIFFIYKRGLVLLERND